jgi:flagellar basal-body rod protein FlgG
MMKSLWVAKTGLDAQQTRMTVTANNLANINTTGFKRDRAVFQDLMYQVERQVGAQNTQQGRLPTGLNLGTGVRTVSTQKIYTEGSQINTGNSLDLSIQGRGFFQIQRPDGTIGYTRDGTFNLDEQGQMVTPNGNLLTPGVSIPSDALAVTIGEDGTVSVQQQGQSAPTQVGQIQLADFINPAGLQPIGNNLLLESLSSGAPQTGQPGLNGLGSTLQGFLEGSNVNMVEELVNMIEVQRAYEMNSKSISNADQMLQFVTNNL